LVARRVFITVPLLALSKFIAIADVIELQQITTAAVRFCDPFPDFLQLYSYFGVKGESPSPSLLLREEEEEEEFIGLFL